MKKYLIFSAIFIGVVSLFVYTQTNDTTTFDILGINITLLNALWIALFLSMFFIFSFIFILTYNIKSFFYKNHLKKDINTLIQNIKNRILYKNEIKNTKILKEFDDFVNNIEGLKITPKKAKNFEFLEDLEKILNKEVVDLKKYKLDNNNPWVIENIKNRILQDEKFAKSILKKSDNEELKKFAFRKVAENAHIDDIISYGYEIDFEIVQHHLKDSNLKYLLKHAKLSPKEEILIARKIYNNNPDEELKTIEPLKWGSVYLYLKYFHIEKAKNIIEENELKFFEYPLKLIENGIKVDIDEYIDSTI